MKTLNINLFGRLLRKKETAGLILTETTYAANLKLSKHVHSLPYFCFVLQGNYQEFNDRKNLDCKSSTLLFHAVGEAHANRFYDSGGRCFNVQLSRAWKERLTLGESGELENASVKRLARCLYSEFARFDDFSHLAIEGIFLEMTAEMLRRKKLRLEPAAPWLKRVKEILHERFGENLSLADLAEQASVHPVHLSRAFRQKFQCTVGEYLRGVRVEFARRELKASNKSLAEISYIAGFSSQSHFTTVFKRSTGATPAEFRKKC